MRDVLATVAFSAPAEACESPASFSLFMMRRTRRSANAIPGKTGMTSIPYLPVSFPAKKEVSEYVPEPKPLASP